MTGTRVRAVVALAAVLGIGVAVAVPQAGADGASPAPLRVVATTPILGDFAREVGGDRVTVTTLLHDDNEALAFEPSLRDMGEIASADVVLANHLDLEPEMLMRAFEATLPDRAELVTVAEEIPDHGGTLIPLVEDAALDTAWLGFTIDGPDEPVTLSVTGHEGPGEVTAFITGAFGQPEPVLQSMGDASLSLAPGSHTHLSWAFTAPGEHTLELEAVTEGGEVAGHDTVRFAVGVAPAEGKPVIDGGHWDIAVTDRGLEFLGDGPTRALSEATVAVPPATLIEVPDDDRFSFLDPTGANDVDEVYLLAQAVIGRHLHGQVDPHVWLDPANARAAATVIADALGRADPGGAENYRASARAYQRRIDSAETAAQVQIAQIPESRRYLVTDYDAYRYLAAAFGLDVADFVAQHPQDQPSTRELVTLSRTIESLRLPAVFVDPAADGGYAGNGTGDLMRLAEDRGVATCPLVSSSFLPERGITDYLSLLKTNARTIKKCLA